MPNFEEILKDKNIVTNNKELLEKIKKGERIEEFTDSSENQELDPLSVVLEVAKKFGFAFRIVSKKDEELTIILTKGDKNNDE
jgi:hypothetical protein